MNQRSEADAVLTSVRQLVTQTARSTARPGGGEGREKLLLTPAFRVDPPSAPEPAPAVAEPPRRAPSALELRIAELERAVSGTGGDWEPDGSEPGDVETPKRFVFQHARQPEPPEESPVQTTTQRLPDIPDLSLPRHGEVAVAEPEKPEGPVAGGGGTSVAHVIDGIEVDEEQLREIVAQMVRAELQGDLGERITHNVRKLVRREIHRALLTRDLD